MFENLIQNVLPINLFITWYIIKYINSLDEDGVVKQLTGQERTTCNALMLCTRVSFNVI